MDHRKQLATTDGCAGCSLDARLLRKTFYTLWAWQDSDAMNRFVRTGAHVRYAHAFRKRHELP